MEDTEGQIKLHDSDNKAVESDDYVSEDKGFLMGPVEEDQGRAINSAVNISYEEHESVPGDGGFEGTHFVLVGVNKPSYPGKTGCNEHDVTDCMFLERKGSDFLLITDHTHRVAADLR